MVLHGTNDLTMMMVTVDWSIALPLTACCLLPLPRFESCLRHVGKVTSTCYLAVVFFGQSSFLPTYNWISNNMAEHEQDDK